MPLQRVQIQREPVALTLLWRRALAPLEFRPLLWLACFAVLGIVLGGSYALAHSGSDLAHLTRFEPALSWPVPVLILGLGLTFGAREKWLWWHMGWGILVLAFFAFYTGNRLAPPHSDVSRLAQISAIPVGPLVPNEARVRGVVADFVQRGELFSQFPLRVSQVGEKYIQGFLWVRASPNFRARVGDEVSFETRLLPLETPSNPGERARFWSSIGASCWARGSGARDLRIERAGVAFGAARRIEEVRAAIFRRYETLFRGQTSGEFRQDRPFAAQTAQLLTAMVWGEGGLVSPLPEQTREDFRVAGLSHLLVASGTQIGIVCMVLGLLTRTFIRRRVLGALVLVFGVTLYALLAGGAPSIWRAALVGFFGVACALAGRDNDLLSIWSGALLLLLLLDPVLAWSLSLQLSFGATWGLIVLTPPLAQFFGRILGPFSANLVGACLGAQWGVLPISLFHFGTWGALSVGANLLIVPLAAAMVIFGAFSLLLPPLAVGLYFTTRFVGWLAHEIASLPGASADSPPFKIGFVALCYGVLLLGLWPLAREWHTAVQLSFERWRKRVFPLNLWPLACFLGLCSAVLTWRYLHPPAPEMRVWILDVGQGHATLIISPQNRAFLIDGGSADDRAEIGAAVLVPTLQSLGVSRLEGVILTGRDSKSCSGLPTVLREIPVSQVFDGTTVKMAPRGQNLALQELQFPFYNAVLGEARRQKIPVRPLSDGLEWRLKEMCVRVLAPPGNNAVAIRASFGQSAILVAPNLSTSDETRLARRVDVRATAFLAPRNGADDVSSLALLRKVAPRVGLISTGRYNSEDTPTLPTLRRFDNIGASVFRTDLHGAIETSCDAKTCRVTPTRELGDKR